jgi:hypothetical protein
MVPRFVAAPVGDHSMARAPVPLALSENPTLSPAALMATASASPALGRTVAVPDGDHRVDGRWTDETSRRAADDPAFAALRRSELIGRPLRDSAFQNAIGR